MTVRTITARRATTCPQCGGGIESGQTIAPMPRSGGHWGHVECVEQYRRDIAADDLDALTMGFGR